MNMQQVGLITYHSPYNYGSVLQAYATQRAFRSLTGVEPEIVDYRPTEGDNYYRKLYFRHQGPKAILADLTMLPVQGKRERRAERFESFIDDDMGKTPKVYKEPDELGELADRYDVVISGSDQIFNKHSNEMDRLGWEYIKPYTLAWSNARKVSYGSSPSSMTDDDIRKIAPDLLKFDRLSAREDDACERLGRLLGKPITNVCDPTLLLTGDQWSGIEKPYGSGLPEEYIFFYSLKRPRPCMRDSFPRLRELSKRTGLPVAVVTPLGGYVPPSKELVNCLDAGPLEFLSLARGARGVITDSYHGTLFSLNFKRPFWTVEKAATDSRKQRILEKLGMRGRIVESIDHIDFRDVDIDWDGVNERLGAFRQQSFDYITSLGIN